MNSVVIPTINKIVKDNASVVKRKELAKFSNDGAVDHLFEDELNRLIKEYLNYIEESKNKEHIYKKRWRQFILFMILRETGCRISEMLLLDDSNDIDFRDNSIRMRTLKQKTEKYRAVFISDRLVAEITRFLMTYPEMKGRLFHIKKRAIQKYFVQMCKLANIPKEKAHVHILRHSKAIEMLRNNIPLHHVRKLLGHSSLLTTSIYLNVYDSELKTMLQEKGML